MTLLRRSVLRSALACLAASVLSLIAASCVEVLDLSDRAGAADELCALLELCFGSEQYPNCREHVASGLEAGEPEARTNWLQSFSAGGDCLLNCSNAKACLDALPVCNTATDSCSQAEHCCGFLDGVSVCGGSGICCKQDKVPCSADAECCTGACNAGSCGEGRPCTIEGDECSEDGDCCSKNCRNGHCAGVCKDANEPCAGDDECCGGICNGDVCACVGLGMVCTSSAECCSNFCDPFTSLCADPGGCGLLGAPCLTPTECCQPLFECGPYGSCCQALGSSCASAADCCSDGCNQVTGLCCNAVGDGCNDPSDCCRGSCSNNVCSCIATNSMIGCKSNGDCCSDSCVDNLCANACPHSVCCSGPPLMPGNGGSASCPHSGEAMCIQTVCAMDSFCCSTDWDAICVSEALTMCGIDCSNVACGTDPQPL